MRDYLFRGKRKDNGEWVYWNIYGEFCTSKGRRTRLTRKTYCSEKYFYHIDEIKQLIDPETVGQYTGLTDKNGKKIFEGDIVKSCEYDDVYFVKYFDNDNYSAFDCVPDVPLCECNGLSYLVNEEGCKVIGNIYDDKEILDVK